MKMMYNKNSIYRYPSQLEELDKKYNLPSKRLIEGFAVSTIIGISTYFTKGLMNAKGQDVEIPEIAEVITLSLPFLANSYIGAKLDDIIEKYNTVDNKDVKKNKLFNSVFYANLVTAGACGASYALGKYLGEKL